MSRIGLVIFLLLVSISFPLVYRFEDYISQWSNLTPQPQIIDLSHLANPQQLCRDNKKAYFAFVKEDQILAQQQNRNRTVLVVGGLRGNDFLGTTAIYHLYNQLQAAKIIFFPVANPSGFIQQVSETYPTGVDVEKDFPLLGASSCFESSAVRILDHLFKTYEIDLTVYLHDGPAGAVYSWTEKENKPGIQLPETPVYKWIGYNLYKQYEGVQNTYLNQQHKPYPFELNREGSDFVDWAYGASKYPQILAPACGNRSVQKYPSFAMNGLVVGLGIGLLEEALYDDGRWEQRVIQRGVKMTQWLVSVVNPTLQIRMYDNWVFQGKLEGCISAHISVLRIYSDSSELVAELVINKTIKGSLGWVDLGPLTIPLEIDIPLRGNVQVEYVGYISVIGAGSTFLSRLSQYVSKNAYEVLPAKEEPPSSRQSKPEEKTPEGQKENGVSGVVSDTDESGVQQQEPLQRKETDEQGVKKQESRESGDPVESTVVKQEPLAESKDVPAISSKSSESSSVKEDPLGGSDRSEKEEGYSWSDLLRWGGYSIGGLFGLCCLVNCFRAGAIVLNARKGHKLNEKFQKVEYVESTDEDLGFHHREESSSLSKEQD